MRSSRVPKPQLAKRSGPAAGDYDASAVLDLADGIRVDICCRLTVDAEAGEIIVDYAGTSEASRWGINVVKNYTHAYTTFTVRSVLSPDIPNNHGSLGPIKVEAPEGSIVNAVPPQPGTARHVVGMFLPGTLLKALAQVRPEEGDGRGVRRSLDDAGQRVSPRRQPVHHCHGYLRHDGVGARASKPGLDACSYPTGVFPAVPIEVVEASAPIRFHQKALRADSGGKGAPARRPRAGHRVRCDRSVMAAQRSDESARGTTPRGLWWRPGDSGAFLVNGDAVKTRNASRSLVMMLFGSNCRAALGFTRSRSPPNATDW